MVFSFHWSIKLPRYLIGKLDEGSKRLYSDDNFTITSFRSTILVRYFSRSLSVSLEVEYFSNWCKCTSSKHDASFPRVAVFISAIENGTSNQWNYWCRISKCRNNNVDAICCVNKQGHHWVNYFTDTEKFLRYRNVKLFSMGSLNNVDTVERVLYLNIFIHLLLKNVKRQINNLCTFMFWYTGVCGSVLKPQIFDANWN